MALQEWWTTARQAGADQSLLARLRASDPRIGSRRELALRVSILLLTVVTANTYLPATHPTWLVLLVAALSALLMLTAALPLVVWAGVWAAFLLLRGYADDFGLPERGDALLHIDRWLGIGMLPTARIHDIAGSASPLVDHLALWIHLSYFGVPHFAAVGLWLLGVRRGDLTVFWRYLLVTGVVMAVGLLLHTLLPASPPWLLADSASAAIDIDIDRVVHGVDSGGRASGGSTLVSDQNPLAAMPSLHLALTLVMALTLWSVDRRLGIVAVVYSVAMAVALVYLGEHWLIDVLVGALIAFAAARAVTRLQCQRST